MNRIKLAILLIQNCFFGSFSAQKILCGYEQASPTNVLGESEMSYNGFRTASAASFFKLKLLLNIIYYMITTAEILEPLTWARGCFRW